MTRILGTNMSAGNSFDLKKAIELALTMQKERSQCNISKHAVGACLVAANNRGDIEYFGGCNQEFSSSFNIHGERVALVKAISEGYVKPLAIIVTSEQKATATMCGYCRQDFMYVNPEVIVYVINPDGTVGIKEKLIDTMKYAYVGRKSEIK